MKTYQKVGLFFLSSMILASCSGNTGQQGSEASSGMPSTTFSMTSEKEALYSKRMDSAKESSAAQNGSGGISGSLYKKVQIQSEEGDPLQVEIPYAWTVEDDKLYPSEDPLDLGYFYFSVDSSQVYEPDYFEHSGEVSPVLWRKMGAPMVNECVFSLEDGTKVYKTDDGAAGTTYANYEWIQDGKRLVLAGVFPQPGAYGEEYRRTPYTEEELIHIMSSLSW